jgi:hypothetical protein
MPVKGTLANGWPAEIRQRGGAPAGRTRRTASATRLMSSAQSPAGAPGDRAAAVPDGGPGVTPGEPDSLPQMWCQQFPSSCPAVSGCGRPPGSGRSSPAAARGRRRRWRVCDRRPGRPPQEIEEGNWPGRRRRGPPPRAACLPGRHLARVRRIEGKTRIAIRVLALTLGGELADRCDYPPMSVRTEHPGHPVVWKSCLTGRLPTADA